ncbi:MAG: carbohydrate-binding protein [Bacteroidia bacterium]|nr:carbohydrate-binding protein [Bacteroidia bacterium]
MPTADLPGKVLMDESDCKSCHLIDKKSAGPAYLDVANKYKGQRGSSDYLAAKIIKGGAGVWGTTEMAAHPQISVDDAKKMVDYIFSLTNKKSSTSLPLSGNVTPEARQVGAYVLKASYADKAVDNVPSLSGTGSVVLRAPMLRADQADEVSKAVKASNQGFIYLDQVKNGGYALYNNIDLTGVKTVMATVTKFGDAAGGSVELRLDAPDGKVIGTTDFSKADHRSPYPGVDVITSPVALTPTEGVHKLYVVFVNPGVGDKTLFFFQQLTLTNK